MGAAGLIWRIRLAMGVSRQGVVDSSLEKPMEVHLPGAHRPRSLRTFRSGDWGSRAGLRTGTSS